MPVPSTTATSVTNALDLLTQLGVRTGAIIEHGTPLIFNDDSRLTAADVTIQLSQR